MRIFQNFFFIIGKLEVFRKYYRIRIFNLFRIYKLKKSIGLEDVIRNSCVKCKYRENGCNRIFVHRLLFKYWD